MLKLNDTAIRKYQNSDWCSSEKEEQEVHKGPRSLIYSMFVEFTSKMAFESLTNKKSLLSICRSQHKFIIKQKFEKG